MCDQEKVLVFACFDSIASAGTTNDPDKNIRDNRQQMMTEHGFDNYSFVWKLAQGAN